MDLELRQDIEDWVSEKTQFYSEMMCQYFLRVHNFTGVDEFGNALEVIPVASMITPSLNHNLLPQAVNNAGRLQEVFSDQGICEMGNQSTQISTEGKPYIKDGELFNAFSLPVSEMLDIFNSHLKSKELTTERLQIHVGKTFAFYLAGRSHDILYGPQKNGLPQHIIKVLCENYKQQPLSAGAIVKTMNLRNASMPNEVVSTISDVNKAFIKASNQEQKIILNKHGYFLNDRSFEIILD